MENPAPDSPLQQLGNLSQLSAFRQLALLFGVAASIALGVAIVLWSQKPDHRILYAQLSAEDAAKVATTLDSNAIPYNIDTTSGVITVPAQDLHRAKLKSRGYNQSELLARPVAAHIEVQLRPDLLDRVIDSPSQAGATDEVERAKRVRDVFEAAAGVEGLHILLIDDVATTGSTINSAAQTLLDAGAWGVSALVLGREL